ncbi:hypothetical protein NQ318_001284 [Aromia moschata]|uniref:DUF4817 domain-containing protein n=1 Tax=Aromia moschata TaxID=1265417 RepID=A0AAV8ZER2_9CUCU|nr:hypothetical protein NQ318_001284 [Aromia moschata]
MPNFTNQELTDIVLCYGAFGNNALQAQRRYQQMFPNRQVPDVRTFVSTVQRLRDYGSFAPRVHDRGRRTRSRRVMDAEEQILEAVEDDPSLSTRRLAHQVRVSQFIVWRTLRILRQTWCLHDGAPPHFARQVRDFLNVEHPNRWIGRNGPIHWPARSPDLTPCDFYLWGYMKQLVYS